MPTHDPIGSLFKSAGLTPVRSTPAAPQSDGTKETQQPTRGFLSSFRKVQRDAGSSRTPRPDNDNQAAAPETPRDPAAPEAREAAPVEAETPPPGAEQVVAQSPSIDELAAEASAALEAAAVVVAAVPLEVAADPDLATAVQSLPATDDAPLPIPLPETPTPRQSVSAMPSALQEWLSAKPVTTAKPAATGAAAPILPDAVIATDTAPGDATAPMPPGLQMALSAVMAAQAAAPSGTPAKTVTNAPVAPVSAIPSSPLVVAAATTTVVPLTEAGPSSNQPVPEIATVAQGLPVQTPSAIPQPVAAPVTEVASTTPAVAIEKPDDEKVSTAAPEAGTPTASAASPLAIPVPAVAVPQAVQPTFVKTDDATPTTTQAAAVVPQTPAATPEIAAPAKSSASSVRNSASTPAPLEVTTAPVAEESLGKDAVAFEPIATPAESERRPATAEKSDAVPETNFPAEVSQDAAPAQPADASSLGPLTAGRNEASPVAPTAPPPVQVAPHDSRALVDTVSQLVLKSHDSGQQLSLQITPPDLGTVRIEVHSHGGVLTARLEADSPAARQLLAEHLPQLRESLQQQGANVDRIDVYQSERAAPGDGTADSGWQSSQQNRQDDAGPLLYDEEEAAEPVPAESRGSLALGELNIRV